MVWIWVTLPKKDWPPTKVATFSFFFVSAILPSLIRLIFELSFFCEDTTVNTNYVSFQSLMKSYSILLLQAILIFQSLKGDLFYRTIINCWWNWCNTFLRMSLKKWRLSLRNCGRAVCFDPHFFSVQLFNWTVSNKFSTLSPLSHNRPVSATWSPTACWTCRHSRQRA